MEISPYEVVKGVVSVLLDVPEFRLDIMSMICCWVVFVPIIERKPIDREQLQSIFVQIQVNLVVIKLNLL